MPRAFRDSERIRRNVNAMAASGLVRPVQGLCPSEGVRVIRQAISCDICAAEKRQTNHWFVAYEQAGELRVSGWSSRHRLRPGSKHLCGQTCLHKLVDEFMAKSIAVRAQRSAESDETEMELAEPARDFRVPSAALEDDRSLTSGAAFADEESAARLLASPVADTSTLVSHPGEPKAASLGVHPNEPRAGSPGLSVLHPTDKDQPPPQEAENTAWEPRQSLEASAYLPHSEVLTMPARTPKISPVPADTLRYASRRWRAEAWQRERERELRAIENRPEIAARRRSSASSSF